MNRIAGLLMTNIIDLDSFRNDVIYIEYEGEGIRAVSIDNIKIEFLDDDTMIEVLDGCQVYKTDGFVNLLIAYLALVKPDLIKWDD